MTKELVTECLALEQEYRSQAQVLQVGWLAEWAQALQSMKHLLSMPGRDARQR